MIRAKIVYAPVSTSDDTPAVRPLLERPELGRDVDLEYDDINGDKIVSFIRPAGGWKPEV